MSRGYTIYAVDFDGTLCENKFPDIGSPNMALIKHLIKRKEQGNKIILWTCRANERLQEAVDWCKRFGLECDAVNSNLPEIIEYWGSESRKIFADVYIDDKAVNKPKYHIPYRNETMGLIDCRNFRIQKSTNEKWCRECIDISLCSDSCPFREPCKDVREREERFFPDE